MEQKCQCCGAPREGTRCGYCGFVEIVDMDGSGTQLVRSMAEEHKRNLVNQLTDLSVVTYLYDWNEEKCRLELKKKEETRVADGQECYPGLYWTGLSFGQTGAGQTLKLELSYRFGGEKKTLSCTLKTVQCEDFWKLGLMVDQSLKLRVFLGTEQQYAEAEPVALELR